MSDLNRTSSAKDKLENIINEHNSLIFDEENWIAKDLRKIAEVTYSYNKETNINTTLFVSGGGLDLELYKSSGKKERKILLLNASNNLTELLNEKKSQIKNALEELELIDLMNGDSVNINIKDLFINSLNEKNNFLDYCLNAIPLEIEKAGFSSTLSKEKEIEKKQEKLDSKLFGGKIKNNPEEVVLSYEYILDKFNENKNILNKKQQKRFEGYLEKIITYLPKGYKYKLKEKPKQISGDFLNYDIPRKDYMLGFNIYIEALEKLEHIVESNENAGSISDGPKGVQFPITQDFESIKILRFFTLGSHEIETHNITDYNGKQIIGNMRGANSTEKDEGVAVLMEQLFKYGKEGFKIDEDGDQIIDIDKIQINSNFIKTLMGEVLDNKELQDFLKLSYKIDKDIISPEERFNRLKRNNKDGVQHKDTTYTRGLLKAIDEINKYIKSKGKEGTNPEDLFLGKISFEETKKLKSIKENKIRKLKEKTLEKVNQTLEKKEKSQDEIEILKPLFLSDAVYFIVTEKLKGKEGNINSKNFYKYLKNKYPIFNFTLEEIEKVSLKTKRNVYAIANIILKTIGKHQISVLSRINKKNVESILNSFSEPYNHRIKHAKERLNPDRRKAK